MLLCFLLFFQGRQKLARFSANEFATLVIDILSDAKLRQWGNSCESVKGTTYYLFFIWNRPGMGLIMYFHVFSYYGLYCQ